MACLPDPGTSSAAADWFKAILGPFIGAGLAFGFALRRDHLLRVKERKAAGNLAILTLLQQTDEFLGAKALIKANREKVLREQPQSPPWMLIKPTHLGYSPQHLRFNLDSLVFVLEYPSGPRVIELLLSAERKYHHFFSLLQAHAEAGEDLQKKLSDSGIDPRTGIRVGDIEKVAGFQLVSKNMSFVSGVFRQIDTEDKIFEDACELLPKTLREIFGRKGVIAITLPDEATLKAQAEESL